MQRQFAIDSRLQLLKRIGVSVLCLLSFDLSGRRWIYWLGLVLLLANVAISLFAVLFNALGYEEISELPLLIMVSLGIFIPWSTIPIVMTVFLVGMAVATITLTAARKFSGVKQNLTQSMYERADTLSAVYATLNKTQRYMYLALFFVVTLSTTIWLVPNLFSINLLGFTNLAPPISLQINAITVAIIGANIHTLIGGGVSTILFYPLLISSFALALNPTNAQLLKRIFYIFIGLIAVFVPFSTFITGLDNFAFDDPTRNTSYLLLAFLPTYLMLALVLPFLYSQRARLAEFGERTKRNMRLLGLGSVAMQLFFMVYWAVLTAPEAGVFYAASVAFALFSIVAWAVVLLLVGERKWHDWAVFALIGAVQVTSLVVAFPNLIS